MEKMFELIDLFFMTQTMKLQGALKAFCEEENGASDMVAVMVLIVIIIAIATLFNGRLSEIVGQILDNLGAFARGGTQ
ncbi:hypothetical protein HMPREF0491_00922 [Lachnospiraceae oral taxon 107 str. F0167]|jgi:hypothetical protein|uniref:hypothetical protein n=1 Tax=Lachnoanaerobaculum sp. Marseille-Q4761 TaxID=2819511 RepID=UPI0002083752|nr:hypothetical protein [Lachnoanaerobaculum sp. Marseille-Q4761]EGG88602.1 hypothetical protein HMPREF0491_00922 [Lachnospiraceae oral taxon 107 str. F0167]MBO1871976.1 hypothetical protein [Lachnoanaerobaculum sp. Marseille-Q4761]RKW43406.1 MAG: hypothetical protein D8H95_32170 [Lachnospiraceae bacterium]